MSLIQRYSQPKKVDPRLIKRRADHTLNSFHVDKVLLPYIILELSTNITLSLVRAMNYSRTLYSQLDSLALYEILDIFEPLGSKGIDALEFYASVAPSTFNRYTYWYSRFLFHAVMFNETYGGKYKYVYDIDIKLLRLYLYSECRRGLKPGTVKVIFAAIKHVLNNFIGKIGFLQENELKLTKLFNLLDRTFGSPRKKKVQLTYYLMAKILETVDLNDLKDVRDWLLVVFSKSAGFRGSTITSAMWADLVVDKYHDNFRNKVMNILVLFLDSTKTKDQKDGQIVTIAVDPVQSAFNLVTLLLHYIKLLKHKGIKSPYIFPTLVKSHHGMRHITANTFSKQLKLLYTRIGGDPKDISSHSARGGLVEDAIAAGIPARFIKSLGRWKSQCWMGYFHDEEYAMACATSKLNEYQKQFDTKKTTKKHKKLLQVISQRKW